MARKIRKADRSRDPKFLEMLESAERVVDEGGGCGLVCETCGKSFPELKAGRCPRCYENLMKVYAKQRALRGF